mgnify:CR=1 FL=1
MSYKLGAFANEVAGAVSIHPQVSIYPHHADTFGQEIGKVLIDLVANRVGADVLDTLDAAVDEINADIEANSGYGHQ